MRSTNVKLSYVCCAGLAGVAIFIGSATPTWAGLPVPTPLVGVTGPVGLVAAGVAFGGYLIFKRLRSRN